jgi:hypothetical protein
MIPCSLLLPLYRRIIFTTYMRIARVRNFDLIRAASAVFIHYITLPLRGNPLHIVPVCDIPADRRMIRSFPLSHTAGMQQTEVEYIS